jgi:hypothetical protein
VITMTDCTKTCFCKDCTDRECFHHGKCEADCPKYRCDLPEPLTDQCDTCEWLDRWYEEVSEK